MSSNEDVTGSSTTDLTIGTGTGATIMDFPLTSTGLDNMTFTTSNDNSWRITKPTPSKEFLEMWKWLRTKLLKELLSDEPKGIKIVNITQKHKPTHLPEYKVEIEFVPVEMKSNLREFEKPEVKNRSPRRGFRT